MKIILGLIISLLFVACNGVDETKPMPFNLGDIVTQKFDDTNNCVVTNIRKGMDDDLVLKCKGDSYTHYKNSLEYKLVEAADAPLAFKHAAFSSYPVFKVGDTAIGLVSANKYTRTTEGWTGKVIFIKEDKIAFKSTITDATLWWVEAKHFGLHKRVEPIPKSLLQLECTIGEKTTLKRALVFDNLEVDKFKDNETCIIKKVSLKYE